MKPNKCKADLYGEADRVLPTCQCGWKGEWALTYDEAADAYAAHRLDEAQLRSIEARNPGINMDEVRLIRKDTHE